MHHKLEKANFPVFKKPFEVHLDRNIGLDFRADTVQRSSIFSTRTNTNLFVGKRGTEASSLVEHGFLLSCDRRLCLFGDRAVLDDFETNSVSKISCNIGLRLFERRTLGRRANWFDY